MKKLLVLMVLVGASLFGFSTNQTFAQEAEPIEVLVEQETQIECADNKETQIENLEEVTETPICKQTTQTEETEPDKTEPLEKGEPNPETVAGDEELTDPQVLGESTTGEILAETGSEVILATITGATLILLVYVLLRITE